MATRSEIARYCSEQFMGSLAVYEESYAEAGGAGFVMASTNGAVKTPGAVKTTGADILVVCGDPSVTRAFEGEIHGKLKLCPPTHENRLALNGFLPFTNPSSAGKRDISFGFGDRLGIANSAHLKAIGQAEIFPVLAQQSMRELTLMKRGYKDVLDAAAWAVFKRGWTKGFGADGDHLKSKGDIKAALDYGFSMITLDCSEALRKAPGSYDELAREYNQIPEAARGGYEDRYLGKSPLPGVDFTKESLMAFAVVYGLAIDFAQDVYESLIKPCGRPIDFEISIDETSDTTELAAHYFVAAELIRRGVNVTSLAPRFIGEFQKGIDYIGDTEAFSENLKAHNEIAKQFGYRISVHSASDKFKVFPSVFRETEGRFHIKTSGTSWLEAVRTIARKEPSLYRRMHDCALKHIDDAKLFYVVHCDISQIPPLDTVTDAMLPEYLEKDDSRQLMHITYGFLFEDPALKNDVLSALSTHIADYESAITAHMRKHFTLLGRTI